MTSDNPLFHFTYCPLCGSNRFVEHGSNARKCLDCGFTYYTNPRGATVAVILNDKNEVLVARRGKKPAKGTLDLVGGFMDLGETVEQAMCREIREETGLDILEGQLMYLFSMPNRYAYSGIVLHTCDMFFLCRVIGHPSVNAMDDVESLSWVPICQLRAEDFGLESIRAGVKQLQNKFF